MTTQKQIQTPEGYELFDYNYNFDYNELPRDFDVIYNVVFINTEEVNAIGKYNSETGMYEFNDFGTPTNVIEQSPTKKLDRSKKVWK